MVAPTGNVWWIKYYRNGKPVRESSESTKETEAKKLLRLREGDVAKGVSVTPRMTIDELPTDLETEYRVNGRDTLKDLEGRLRLHIRPYFGGRRAAAITTADIRDFISKRQNTGGASNGEINRELAAIKRAFNLAIQGGKLIHAPTILFMSLYLFSSLRLSLEFIISTTVGTRFLVWGRRLEIWKRYFRSYTFYRPNQALKN